MHFGLVYKRVFSKLHIPMLTDVLSTPTEVQLSHGFSTSSSSHSLLSMLVKMASAVALEVEHMSKKDVTILLRYTLTVMGFIFSSPESLEPSIIREKAPFFIFVPKSRKESLHHLTCTSPWLKRNGTVRQFLNH